MEEIKLICKKCNTEKTIDEMRKDKRYIDFLFFLIIKLKS